MHRRWPLHDWLRRLALSVGAFAAFLAFASAVNAGNYSFTNDIPVTLEGSGITVHILAGSSADSFDIQPNTLQVVVAGGETLTLRYPGPNPGTLANDGGLSSCNNVGGNNDVAVAGPKTVTFTPTTTSCPAPSGGGGGGSGLSSTSPPKIVVAKPNGGETIAGGSTTDILWSYDGPIQTVRLYNSADSGLTWTLIAGDQQNDGHHAWAPSTATTRGRVKIEGIVVGGSVGASDTSDADFTVTGQVVTPSESINEDKSIAPPPQDEPPPSPPACIGGTLIKGPLPAVYYCGSDGKRYVFPNQATYFSWYADFKSVITVTSEILARVPLGGNVTFRPGSLVKIVTDPKVYVVSRGGVLRWITSESLAIALFGASWARLVHDVPDVFFIDYVIGEPITSAPLPAN